MKKLLLSSLLCTSVLLSAEMSNDYELMPIIGLSDEIKANRDESYNNVGIAVARNLKDNFLDQVELAFLRSEDVSYKNSSAQTNINRFFVNGLKDYPLTEKLSAFGLAGLGYQNFTNEQNGSEDDFFGNYGLGLKYKLDHNLTLRTDARHLISFDGEDSLLYTLSIAMPIGGETKKKVEAPKQMIKEEVKKIEPKVMPKDSDNDGVIDANDNCPTTPAGVRVNSKGCELDSDNDGVVDRLDQCPTTKAGVEVTANGCELDSDNDGIVDSLDKCPYSPADAVVNTQGCAEKLELKINFDSNSAKIRNEDKAELEALAKFLEKKAEQGIVIEAHTDSRGSAAYNLNLSKKRAASAKKSLVNLGIDASRIDAIGFGETQPVSTNATAEGREENRRITVIFK